MHKAITEIQKHLVAGVKHAQAGNVLESLQAADSRGITDQVLTVQDKFTVLYSIDDTINSLSATLLQMRLIKKIVDARYGTGDPLKSGQGL